jgi:hypothetical protein
MPSSDIDHFGDVADISSQSFYLRFKIHFEPDISDVTSDASKMRPGDNGAGRCFNRVSLSCAIFSYNSTRIGHTENCLIGSNCILIVSQLRLVDGLFRCECRLSFNQQIFIPHLPCKGVRRAAFVSSRGDLDFTRSAAEFFIQEKSEWSSIAAVPPGMTSTLMPQPFPTWAISLRIAYSQRSFLTRVLDLERTGHAFNHDKSLPNVFCLFVTEAVEKQFLCSIGGIISFCPDQNVSFRGSSTLHSTIQV